MHENLVFPVSLRRSASVNRTVRSSNRQLQRTIERRILLSDIALVRHKSVRRAIV